MLASAPTNPFKTNPNTYFTGLMHRRDAEERRLVQGGTRNVYEEAIEVGADGQWGIFSMTIPGRVGYQVKN